MEKIIIHNDILMLMPQVNKQTDNTALITLFIDLMLCKTTKMYNLCCC